MHTITQVSELGDIGVERAVKEHSCKSLVVIQIMEVNCAVALAQELIGEGGRD